METKHFSKILLSHRAFWGRLISRQVEMLLTFTSFGFNSSEGGCFGLTDPCLLWAMALCRVIKCYRGRRFLCLRVR